MEEDRVNHPKHYEWSCSIECIDMMQAMFGKDCLFDYCCMNAFKYLWRYKFKNGDEDVAKAAWYIDKAENYLDELNINSIRKYNLVKSLYDSVIMKK